MNIGSKGPRPAQMKGTLPFQSTSQPSHLKESQELMNELSVPAVTVDIRALK